MVTIEFNSVIRVWSLSGIIVISLDHLYIVPRQACLPNHKPNNPRLVNSTQGAIDHGKVSANPLPQRYDRCYR